MPRRRPDRAQADAARDDPGRHRRGPPDPPLERGRDGSAWRTAGQPVRRRPRPAAPVADPRGHRAVSTRPRSRSPRRPSARRSWSRPSTARRRSRSSRGPSPRPRSGFAARASRISAGGSRGDLHVLVDVVVPTTTVEAPARAAAGLRRGCRRARLGRRRTAREARTGVTSARDEGAGAWLEMAVDADVEAVEAVSEILGRSAPGGTSVEPAFELVNEGLGARVDVDPTGDGSRVRARARPRVGGSRRRAGRRGARTSPGVRAASHR